MFRPTFEYAHLAEVSYGRRVYDIGEADGAARAIIQHDPDGPVLAIPGTDNIATWLADLDIATIHTNLGTVHAGFRQAAMSIRDDVFAAKPRILVGHSEGAAIALILAGWLAYEGQGVERVYAFEPPRITTDDTLADLYRATSVDARLYRHGEDIVPMVPRLIEDWQHPADLIQFGKPALPVWNIEDHEIGRIVSVLKQNKDL